MQIMKKFSFELQKVLEFRNFEKQKAEGELAKALAVENEINQNLEKIAQQYLVLKNQMKGCVDFSDMVSSSQYSSLLDFQKEELLKQLAEAQIVTEEKREILRECMKKTTALEKLRDKQKEDWKNAVDYEEAEAMDDLRPNT